MQGNRVNTMPAETLHTIDSFFAHVKEHGFNGYTPHPSDTMGDSWARHIGELFQTVAEAHGLDRNQQWQTASLIFQWLYCQITGMQSRVIASPAAMRAAGYTIDDTDISLAIELLLASQEF